MSLPFELLDDAALEVHRRFRAFAAACGRSDLHFEAQDQDNPLIPFYRAVPL